MGRLDYYADDSYEVSVCCDYCNEIYDIKFDCPVCKETASMEFGDYDIAFGAKIGEKFECEECKNKFIFKGWL